MCGVGHALELSEACALDEDFFGKRGEAFEMSAPPERTTPVQGASWGIWRHTSAAISSSVSCILRRIVLQSSRREIT